MRLTTIPEYVMRTGSISVFDPRQARAGVTQRFVEDTVRTPVGREPVRPVSVMASAMLGQDAAGRPVRQFDVSGMPSTGQAKAAVSALKDVAKLVRRRGLATSVTPIVTGPLAALARGETVVLRFTNGVAISAAL